MTIDFLSFNGAVVAAGQPPVREQRSFDSMLAATGSVLTGVLCGVRADDPAARAWLTRFVRAGRLLDVGLRLDLDSASWSAAFHVVAAHGLDKVRETARCALQGDAGARARLRDWFLTFSQVAETPWMAAGRLLRATLASASTGRSQGSLARSLSPTGKARLVTKGVPRRPTHRTEARARAVALAPRSSLMVTKTKPVVPAPEVVSPLPTFLAAESAGRPVTAVQLASRPDGAPYRLTAMGTLLLGAIACGLVDEAVLQSEDGVALLARRQGEGITVGPSDRRGPAEWVSAAAVAIAQACSALSVESAMLAATLSPLVAAQAALGAVTAKAPAAHPSASPKRQRKPRCATPAPVRA